MGLILIDVRGRGASDKPHDSPAYNSQNLVGDLVAVLDDLNITEAGFLGYSMGGMIGFRIPIYAPQRLRFLMLGGAAYPITGKEESEDVGVTQNQQRLEDAIRESPENPMEFYVAAMGKRAGPIVPWRRADLLANDAQALLASVRMFRSEISPKAESVLPKIKIPCLLFAGEADLRFPAAKECAAYIPGARFAALPGLDHMQAYERSDLALPHIKEFLAEVAKS